MIVTSLRDKDNAYPSLVVYIILCEHVRDVSAGHMVVIADYVPQGKYMNDRAYYQTE